MAARAGSRFPRERRIRKRAEFTTIQAEGARVVAGGFIFLLRARADGAPSRLGITVSRKYGNAVERNRFKRLVREAFRLFTPPLVPPGTDVIVIPRGRADPSTKPRLADVLEQWRGARPLLYRRADDLHRKVAQPANSTHTSRGPGPANGRKART